MSLETFTTVNPQGYFPIFLHTLIGSVLEFYSFCRRERAIERAASIVSEKGASGLCCLLPTPQLDIKLSGSHTGRARGLGKPGRTCLEKLSKQHGTQVSTEGYWYAGGPRRRC